MSKFKKEIDCLKEYCEELTPALIIVLLKVDKGISKKKDLELFLKNKKELKHSDYLEIISMAYGFKNYNVLSNYLKENKANSIEEIIERTKIWGQHLHHPVIPKLIRVSKKK